MTLRILRHALVALQIAAIATLPSALAGAPVEEKLKAGDTAPPKLGVTREGEDVETTQFAGKVLIVTFWASWCGPCRKELPLLEGIQRAAKGAVQVVAVNIEERDQFRAIVRTLGPTLTLKLSHDYRKQGRDAYGVNGIPHMVLIGRDGKVKKVYRGYSEESVDRIIAEVNKALADEA